jgi:hypothetical protein
MRISSKRRRLDIIRTEYALSFSGFMGTMAAKGDGMVRREDLEELAQVLQWGEMADNYVLLLDDALSGRLRQNDVRITRETQAAGRLLNQLSQAETLAKTPSFDRLSVYYASSGIVEDLPERTVDPTQLLNQLGALNGAQKATLESVQQAFERIGEAMHRAARELSSREPAVQF